MVSWLVWRARGEYPKIETEVILFSGQKKIEFINHVHKTEVYTKEGVYFAFPFAMEHPQFRYEIQNGFVDPSRDQFPARERSGSPCNTGLRRMKGVFCSADTGGRLVGLPGGYLPRHLAERIRPTSRNDFLLRDEQLLAYQLCCGTRRGFHLPLCANQRPSMSPADLSRLGWEEMTPAEVDWITKQDKAIDTPRPLAAKQGSFVQVNQPNVVLMTWKMAEDGEGTIMRFLETGGQTSTVEVQAPYVDVKSAWSSDALERKQSALATTEHGFRFPIKPFEIVTVRLKGAGNVRQIQ